MRNAGVIARLVWLEAVRRKDLYVLLVLLGALLAVVMSVDVFGLGGVGRYVLETALLLSWLFSIALTVTVAGRQLPAEEQKGTVFALLAKPVTRFELLAGKWAGSVALAATANAAFYAVTAAAGALRGAPPGPAAFLQAYLLHTCALGLLAACALAFSTRGSADAASTLTYLAAAAGYVVVPAVPRLVAHADRLSASALTFLYYALPHLEFFDLRRRVVHGWGPAPWDAAGLALLYGLGWSALLLGAAWLAYRRRYFRRGGA